MSVLEEEGLDSDGAVSSKSKLQSKVKALSGVDILTDTGAYKSTYQILSEIADVWSDINNMDQAALLELISGKRNSSVIAAILQNPTELKAAFEDANNAQGSALKENEKYLDSIQGKIDQFTNATQTMWSNALNSDVVKFFVEFGTTLVKIIDDIGLFKAALIGVGMYLTRGVDFTGFSKPIEKTVANAQATLADLKADMDAAVAADAAQKTTQSHKKAEEATNRYKSYELQVKEIEAEDALTTKAQERIKLQEELNSAQERYEVGLEELGGADQDGSMAIEAYNEMERLQTKIDENGMSIDDANARMQAFNNTVDQTGKKSAISFDKFNAKMKSVGKQIAGVVAQMAAMYAITTAMELVVKLGSWIGEGVDDKFESAEEAQDKFDKLNNELSDTQKELRSLESELDNTSERMDELLSMGTLSFVEQEELNNLKKQSDELEHQIELTKILEEKLKSIVSLASINASQKTFSQTSFYSEESKSDRAAEAKESGSTWGSAAGMALGLALSFIPGMQVGALALMGAGAFGGSIVGGMFGESSANSEYDSEKSVTEVLNNMAVERQKLEKTRDEAYAAYVKDPENENLAKQWEEAQSALGTYDTTLAQHISQMQQYLNAIDPDSLTNPADKAYYEQMQKWVDTYAVTMGGSDAKASVIERLFGEDATGKIAKARDDINKLKEDLAKAKKSGKGVDEALANLKDFKLDLDPADIERLRQMGIYLYEVEDYFKEVIDTESEFIDNDLEDVAKDINKITDGLGSLKSAFEEVIDQGVLTAKTIMALKEELEIGTTYAGVEDVTNAWREYLDVMMSGTATTEEMTTATEGLAQSIMEAALETNSLTPENKFEYIAQLQALGITNAEEYVDDLLQKNMVKELEDKLFDAYQEAGKRAWESNSNVPLQYADQVWDAMTDEQRMQAIAEYGDGVVGQLSADTITEIAKAYGVEETAIAGVIEKINEKARLEQQIADRQKQQNALNDWRNGKNGQKGFAALQQELNAYETIIKEYNAFSEGAKSFNTDFWTAVPGSYGSQFKNSTTGDVLNRADFERLKAESQRFEEWKKNNQARYDEYLKLKQQYDALWTEGVSKGYIVDGQVINPNFQAEIDQLNAEIEGIETEIDTEITVDVELELELQNKNDLVDDLQSIFDTLSNAAKEYDENGGKVSVDTFQELLKLEPKYLAMLYNEHGQITLNKEALLQVAQARLYDMTQKQIDSIITTATNAAKSGEIEKLKELTQVLYNTAEAQDTFNTSALQGLRIALADVDLGLSAAEQQQYYDAVEGQVNAVIGAYQKSAGSIDLLGDTFSTDGNTLTDAAKSDWDKLISYYENHLALITNERDLIEAEIDKAEARGGKASAEYYEDLIRTSAEEKTLLEEQYSAMQRYLEANADTLDQDTWTEYNNSLNEIAVSIKECETNTIQWQEALREIDIHYFEQATNEISRLGQELDFVNGLLEDEDVADENGNWSSAALTRMGMYMNQIEAAAADTQRYQDEIAKLNQQYDAGELSEEQYQDRLATLTDGLYDSINAQEEARDGIVELNEARIDAIKEGIEKEIEAYEDYIDVVKESLDAERDLYDFKKKVTDQTKDINQLERRIASLSGATDAASIAERRKLEAQLLEAKEGLNDTYYDHSKDAQQNALDSEAESYREAQEKRIEDLEKTLEDTETLIYNSMMDVLFNADVVYQELNDLTDKYGDILSDELKEPWEKAAQQATDWKDELQETMGSLYTTLLGENGEITLFASGISEKLSGSWDDAKSAVETYSDFLTGSELGSNLSNTITGFANQIQKIIDKWTGVKNAADSAYRAQMTANDVGGNDNSGSENGNGYQQYTSPKKYYCTATYNEGTKVLTSTGVGDTQQQAEDNALARLEDAYHDYKIAIGVDEDAIPNMWYRNKHKAQTHTDYYAKGTTGTKRNQWAITDEPQFGDELVLVPGKDGNLSFMRKGTGVVPADLTANLMEWGQFTPDSLKLGSGVNVNMINNAVIKPQYDFSFDSLVHVDNCSQETLKDLEKMVDSKIDKFSKDLNYSIKRFSR